MDKRTRQYHLSRIISGSWIYQKDRLYVINLPSREHRLLGEIVYNQVYDDAIYRGLEDEDGIMKMLLKQKMWSKEKDKEVEGLKKEAEDCKVGIYNNQLNSKLQDTFRSKLHEIRQRLDRLHLERHQFDHFSAEYTAFLARQKFLVGCGTTVNGHPYWSRPLDDYLLPDGAVDYLFSRMNKDNLTEPQLREIAKSEEWKNIYNVKGNVFDHPSVDMTDEQRSLLLWSQMYENISNHPQSPPDSVVADDDMIDGWIIIQRRERIKNAGQSEIERMAGNNANKGEVFIITDKENADKVYSNNDLKAKINMAQRQKVLQEKGRLDELYMPDTQLELRMRMNAGQG